MNDRASVSQPQWWFIALDRARGAQLMTECARTPFIGWLHFQTLYGHLAATQPDMLA
jgi:hypothetical protein